MAVKLTAFKIARIRSTAGIGQSTLAFEKTFLEKTYVFISIAIGEATLAIVKTLLEEADVFESIGEYLRALAVELTAFELARVRSTAGIGQSTLAFEKTFLEKTDVLISIDVDHRALAVVKTLLEEAYVFISIQPGQCALAVKFAVRIEVTDIFIAVMEVYFGRPNYAPLQRTTGQSAIIRYVKQEPSNGTRADCITIDTCARPFNGFASAEVSVPNLTTRCRS